jgi:ribosomal protein S18 acetylase RimI-like enzyme
MKIKPDTIQPIIYSSERPPIDQFWELFLTTGWNRDYQITLSELAIALENSQYYLSAYQGDKLVGFGRIVTDGITHAMIFDMIIDPAFQRRGIGSQILKGLLKYCFERRIRDIQLFCARGKIAFYEAHGFRARPDDAPGMQYRGPREPGIP